jgi:hypothetical protein
MDDDPRNQRPGETANQWRHRLEQMPKVPTDGDYMATRDRNGEYRNGAARMFERYGWF